MTKKTRLSFSELSKDERIPENKLEAREGRQGRMPARAPERKRVTKTYQYSKFGKGRGRGAKPLPQRREGEKIPPLAPGNIRMDPGGGVKEIGKNTTAVEFGEDIVVIEAGMQLKTEVSPGIDTSFRTRLT